MTSRPSPILDALTQAMRCETCGAEVPIPFGHLGWVSAVAIAFQKAHRRCKPGDQPCTWFSTPVKK